MADTNKIAIDQAWISKVNGASEHATNCLNSIPNETHVLHMSPTSNITCLGTPDGKLPKGSRSNAFESHPLYSELPRPGMLPLIHVPRDEDGEYSDHKKRIMRCLMGDFSVKMAHMFTIREKLPVVVLFAYARASTEENESDIIQDENCCYMVSVLLTSNGEPFLDGRHYPEANNYGLPLGVLPELVSARILHHVYRQYGAALRAIGATDLFHANLREVYKRNISETAWEALDLEMILTDSIIYNCPDRNEEIMKRYIDVGSRLILVDRPSEAANLVHQALTFLNGISLSESDDAVSLINRYISASKLFCNAKLKLEFAQEILIHALHLALGYFPHDASIWKIPQIQRLVDQLIYIYILLAIHKIESHEDYLDVAFHQHRLMAVLQAAGFEADDKIFQNWIALDAMRGFHENKRALKKQFRTRLGAMFLLVKAFASNDIAIFHDMIACSFNHATVDIMDYSSIAGLLNAGPRRTPEQIAKQLRKNITKNTSGRLGGAIYTCSNCGQQSTQVRFKVCPCTAVSYCSTECQRAHWPVHKKQCTEKKKKKKDKNSAKN